MTDCGSKGLGRPLGEAAALVRGLVLTLGDNGSRMQVPQALWTGVVQEGASCAQGTGTWCAHY